MFHRLIYIIVIIGRGMVLLVYDLFDLFSSNAGNYDSDWVIKTLDTNVSRFYGVGYGIQYFVGLSYDIEYCKSTTKKDLIIAGANDDIGAVQIISDYVVQRNILGEKADDYGFPEPLVDVDQDIHIAQATTS